MCSEVTNCCELFWVCISFLKSFNEGEDKMQIVEYWKYTFQLGLGDIDKIKYRNIFDQIPQYWYCDNIVGMTNGAFTKYLYNEIFDK